MNEALIEIMSSKPHKIKKQWFKDRADKEKGVKFDSQSKNLDISKRINRLNMKIGGDYEAKETYMHNMQKEKKRISHDKSLFEFMGL